ncbi:hypothetical protein Tco_0601758 [Tanacetum coccineum]
MLESLLRVVLYDYIKYSTTLTGKEIQQEYRTSSCFSVEEAHCCSRRETKARTILLQFSYLRIHMADFIIQRFKGLWYWLSKDHVWRFGSDFARECTGKQLDSKARYSTFKLKELDKSEEPKALLSDGFQSENLLVKFY